MLETKRITSYGKRATRIVYVSDEPRVPHGSPFTSHRSSRENTSSRSPPFTRKILGRGRKVKGLSTSPRGSPKSGNVGGIASKKLPPGLTMPTPKRWPLSLLPSSPSIVFHGQKSTQTPNTKVSKFAPFVDSEVVVIDEPGCVEVVQWTRRANKGTLASSKKHTEEVMEESSEIIRPPRKRAAKQTVILTDEEEEELTFRLTRRGARARPIVISDESSDDYSQIVPVKPGRKAHTLRPTKTQPNFGPKELRPPKMSSQRVQADVSLSTAQQTLQPKSGRGHVAALLPPPVRKSASKVVPVRPSSPRRSQRKVSGNSHNRTRPLPPSTSEFELELELAALTLSVDKPPPSHQALQRPSGPSPGKTASTSQHLASLLAESAQTEPHCFSTFIETFPFDDVHGQSPHTDLRFRKIGEASYSEVFAIGDVVLKIVPLRDESSAVQVDDGVDADLPQESEIKDVLQEIMVTRAMGQICPGFIKLLKTYVVQGRYPPLLLSLWDGFNDAKSSDNIRPDIFPPTQAYALLVLPHGGPDLEAYTFPVKTGWRQACSIFWQTAKALATAEELVSFEHRDLHWGQILVQSNFPIRKVVARTPRRRVGESSGDMVLVPMDHPRHGVTATIIDLGFARMNAGDGSGCAVHWTPFDELIFEGEGDYQFDVYRLMQRHHGDTWDQFRPLTNVMWLHYLTSKLLHSKRLRPPGARNAITVPNEYSERQCYDCLVELEQLLRNSIRQTKVKKSRGGGAKEMFDKAGDVVYFARVRGWLE